MPDAADADPAPDTLPERVVDEAARLTRYARDRHPGDDPRYPSDDEFDPTAEREEILETYGFTARVREEDTGDVLVLHPGEWHEDGVVRTDRIEDLSRAEEIPIEGPGDPEDWEEINAQNRALVEQVRQEHGAVHGENAAAFADFMGNYYARRIETATSAHLEEFCTEYFVRNAFPSDAQRDLLDESMQVLFETAETPVPADRDQ
jgi:hypothetical protein